MSGYVTAETVATSASCAVWYPDSGLSPDAYASSFGLGPSKGCGKSSSGEFSPPVNSDKMLRPSLICGLGVRAAIGSVRTATRPALDTEAVIAGNFTLGSV